MRWKDCLYQPLDGSDYDSGEIEGAAVCTKCASGENGDIFKATKGKQYISVSGRPTNHR